MRTTCKAVNKVIGGREGELGCMNMYCASTRLRIPYKNCLGLRDAFQLSSLFTVLLFIVTIVVK